MKSSYLLYYIAILSGMSLPTASGQMAIRLTEPPRTPVLTTSLNTTHELIGPLGLPLGEVVAIAATVKDEHKTDGYDYRIVVTAIDGRILVNPLQMPAKLPQSSEIPQLVPSQQMMLRVYQDGGMIGVPRQAVKGPVPIAPTAYAFKTWLVIVSATDRDG